MPKQGNNHVNSDSNEDSDVSESQGLRKSNRARTLPFKFRDSTEFPWSSSYLPNVSVEGVSFVDDPPGISQDWDRIEIPSENHADRSEDFEPYDNDAPPPRLMPEEDESDDENVWEGTPPVISDVRVVLEDKYRKGVLLKK